MNVAKTVFCLSLVWLSGCQGWQAERDAQETVGRLLKDPSSAQYQNVTYVSSKEAVCGEVNAKNSYGAYVGFRRFHVRAGKAMLEPSDALMSIGPNAELEQAVAAAHYNLHHLRSCTEDLTPLLSNDPVVLNAQEAAKESKEKADASFEAFEAKYHRD